MNAQNPLEVPNPPLTIISNITSACDLSEMPHKSRPTATMTDIITAFNPDALFFASAFATRLMTRVKDWDLEDDIVRIGFLAKRISLWDHATRKVYDRMASDHNIPPFAKKVMDFVSDNNENAIDLHIKLLTSATREIRRQGDDNQYGTGDQKKFREWYAIMRQTKDSLLYERASNEEKSKFETEVSRLELNIDPPAELLGPRDVAPLFDPQSLFIYVAHLVYYYTKSTEEGRLPSTKFAKSVMRMKEWESCSGFLIGQVFSATDQGLWQTNGESNDEEDDVEEYDRGGEEQGEDGGDKEGDVEEYDRGGEEQGEDGGDNEGDDEEDDEDDVNIFQGLPYHELEEQMCLDELHLPSIFGLHTRVLNKFNAIWTERAHQSLPVNDPQRRLLNRFSELCDMTTDYFNLYEKTLLNREKTTRHSIKNRKRDANGELKEYSPRRPMNGFQRDIFIMGTGSHYKQNLNSSPSKQMRYRQGPYSVGSISENLFSTNYQSESL